MILVGGSLLGHRANFEKFWCKDFAWETILYASSDSFCRGYIFLGHALNDKGVQRIEGFDQMESSKAKRVAIVSRIKCKQTAYKSVVKHGLCSFTASHQICLFVALNVLSEQVWSMPRVLQEIRSCPLGLTCCLPPVLQRPILQLRLTPPRPDPAVECLDS